MRHLPTRRHWVRLTDSQESGRLGMYWHHGTSHVWTANSHIYHKHWHLFTVAVINQHKWTMSVLQHCKKQQQFTFNYKSSLNNSCANTDITREQFKRSLKSWLFECAYGRRRVWETVQSEGAPKKWTYLLTYLRMVLYTSCITYDDIQRLAF